MKKLLSLKQVDWKLSTSIAMMIFDFNKKEFVTTDLSRLWRIYCISFILVTRIPFQ